jgi:hypothetical protein
MGDDNPIANYSPFETAESKSPQPHSIVSPPVAGDPEDEEVSKLERRLNILESQISMQEKELTEARETGMSEPPPNWPKIYPIVYFDIKEVPEALQSFVNLGMFGWCCMVVSFSLNFITCLTLLRAGDAADSPGSKIALSALYLFLLVPISLDLNALAVYRDLKSASTRAWSFAKLFIFLGLTTAYQALLTLGLESSGSCGLVAMVNLMINGHGFIGFLSLLVTAGLALSTFVHFRLFTGLWNYYRATGQGGGDIERNLKTVVAEMVVNVLK